MLFLNKKFMEKILGCYERLETRFFSSFKVMKRVIDEVPYENWNCSSCCRGRHHSRSKLPAKGSKEKSLQIENSEYEYAQKPKFLKGEYFEFLSRVCQFQLSYVTYGSLEAIRPCFFTRYKYYKQILNEPSLSLCYC